jgi:hypothetical protein
LLHGTVRALDARALVLSGTFSVAQAGVPALSNLAVASTGNSTATISFRAPVLPIGQVVPSVVNLTITARNTGGAVSAAEFTSVTVKPLPDVVAVATALYRISKQRLVITASTTVISPSNVLTLQPYLTTAGTIFDPANLGNVFTNAGGVLTLTLVGAPRPACNAAFATPCQAAPLVIKSTLGGVSPPSALTDIRQ